MAEVKRDDKGEIESITYTDHVGYTARVDRPDPTTGRVRILTAGKAGGGSPVDLEPAEARKLAHDLADLAGAGD